MRIKELDERLKLCLEYAKGHRIVADIGTDHAYLPINLVSTGIAEIVYACDINKSPLQKAQKNICKYNMQDKIKTVLTDGLLALEDKNIDVAIIAGMGAQQIIRIIDNAPFVKSLNVDLILQAMSNTHLLRLYLKENNFEIKKEQAIKTNDKIYTVMLVRYKKNSKNTDSIYLGKLSYENGSKDILDEYILSQIKNLQNIAQGAKCRGEKTEYLKINEDISYLEKFIKRGENSGNGKRNL